MDLKPTKEQIEDFKNHICSRFLEDKIRKDMENCKEALLHETDIIKINRLQQEHQTLKGVLNKFNYAKKSTNE